MKAGLDLNPVDVGLPKLHGIEALEGSTSLSPGNSKKKRRQEALGSALGGYVVQKQWPKGDLLNWAVGVSPKNGCQQQHFCLKNQAAIFRAR